MASLRATIFSSLSLVLLLLCIFSDAHQFQVGFWKVPSSPDEFQNWAARNRFQVSDIIVFKYDGKGDSVLEVTAEDYKSCNTSGPNKPYTGGDTAVVLDRSGPFFFISGVAGHCQKGQKLEIKVLSRRNNHHHPPAGAPVLVSAPAPAPSRSSRVLGGGVAVAAGVLANLIF